MPVQEAIDIDLWHSEIMFNGWIPLDMYFAKVVAFDKLGVSYESQTLCQKNV